MLIRNRTNDLYKFAVKKKHSLGHKWLRLIPYLVRAAVAMNPEFRKWSREEMFLEVDKATRHFLNQRGLL